MPECCLSDNDVVEFVEGRASPAMRRSILAHLDGCATCRALLAESVDTEEAPTSVALSQTDERRPTDDDSLAPPLPRGADAKPPPALHEIRLVKPIGRGAMGQVYLGHDTLLDRKVAVKFMIDLDPDAERRERFLVEARAIARLSHPNVVTVHRVGEEDGRLYLVSEFIEGKSLAEIQKPLPLREVVRIGLGLARGLAAAHKRGVLHRDIKPANAMLTADGEVKLLDFGLAKLMGTTGTAQAERSAEYSALASAMTPSVTPAMLAGAFPVALSQSLTATGALLGTPLYMAPEVWVGRPATQASDIYSLGVVLFELATGRPCFVADSLQALEAEVTTTDAPFILSVRPELSRALATIIDRCTLRQPERRYQDTADLLSELETLAGTLGLLRQTGSIIPLSSAWSWTRQRLALGLLTAVCGAMAGSYGLYKLRHARALAPTDPTPLVDVAGGTFQMGSSRDDVDAAYAWCQHLLGNDCVRELLEREYPPRKVTVSSFRMEVTEVTNAQLAQWLNRQPGLTITEGRWVADKQQLLADLYPPYSPWYGLIRSGARFAAIPGGERKPATQVTWELARRYCESLGRRLPTEAEWEFAARGRGESRFPWGFDEPSCEGVVFARSTNQRCAAQGQGPIDVGTAEGDRTPQGIMDLGGNVSEWVADRFLTPYEPCGTCQDPLVAAIPGQPTQRVNRGGNWMFSAPDTRAASRNRWDATGTVRNVGFRCIAAPYTHR